MLPCLPKTTFSLIISNHKDNLHWKSMLFGIRQWLTFFSTAYFKFSSKISCFLRKWGKKITYTYTHNPSCSKVSVSLFFSIEFWLFPQVYSTGRYMSVGIMPVPLDQIVSLTCNLQTAYDCLLAHMAHMQRMTFLKCVWSKDIWSWPRLSFWLPL